MGSNSKDTLESRVLDALKANQTSTCLELLRSMRLQGTCNGFWDFLYGESLRKLGLLDEAEGVLLRVYNSGYEGQDIVETSLGKLYDSRLDFQTAEEWFRKATLSRPENTGPWVYLGVFLLGRNRIGEAIDTFSKGLSAEGNLDEIYVNLGLCYRLLGQYELALGYFTRAMYISPTYALAQEMIADVSGALEAKQERERLN